MSGENVKNYIFISYAHKDEGKVLPVLRAMEDQNIRFWYDEGLEAGQNWPQTIAEKLRDSGAMIAFLSAHSLASQNCSREINYAVAGKKEILKVRLDKTELPPDMAMQLSVCRDVPYGDPETVASKVKDLLGDSFVRDSGEVSGGRFKKHRKKVNVWAIVAAALAVLFLAGIIGFFGLLKGWFGSKPIVEHTVIETDDGNEVEVTELNSSLAMEVLLKSSETGSIYLAGNYLLTEPSVIRHDETGFYLNEKPVERGIFSDFSWLNADRVRELALVNESVESLDGIEALTKLTYLDLSGNEVRDLKALTSLKNLEVLKILDLPEDADLSALPGCESLKQVIIGFPLRDQVGPLVQKGVEVIIRR
ncbi:MAG: TIR domain-containing protein [Lachnospiraceae bacterium]|nr:TIR domain-containing protein [Lachnospiraceae bacterium]